ncbi:hypothetical protein K443DRAFT_110020, partial [Laccaria amethystina LaAM-08-1]
LRACSSRIVAVVKELQFDSGIDIGLEEGEKSDIVPQCWEQSFFSPFALGIHPSTSEGAIFSARRW